MCKELKILIVEDGQYYIYGKALKDAFLKKGFANTKIFALGEYLPEHDGIYKRIQIKLALGPEIHRLNNLLIKCCESDMPDLIFLYRCRMIYPATIKKIKSNGTVVFSYNNDNPFSEYYPGYYWRHYCRSLKYDDLTFVFRDSNIEECLNAGAQRAEVLRAYYIENENYPMKGVDKNYDVVFLGHYEEDGRLECLSALAEVGISVGIPRNGWKGVEEQNKHFIRLDNTQRDYNLILNKSRIALVFLSSLNKDTYTTRCFEIPATKTFMLSRYTDDLAGMFEPDKEAVYFKTPSELVDKVKYYLENEEQREQIAQAGYDRLIQDGHEICDRVMQIVDRYYEITEKY